MGRSSLPELKQWAHAAQTDTENKARHAHTLITNTHHYLNT